MLTCRPHPRHLRRGRGRCRRHPFHRNRVSKRFGSPQRARGRGNANGRREINWDIVPAAQAAPNNLPPDFFNKNSVRGVVLALDTPGLTAFQVSGNEGEAPIRFDNLLPGNSNLFPTYSAQKLFTSVGANDYNVDFYVPGHRYARQSERLRHRLRQCRLALHHRH